MDVLCSIFYILACCIELHGCCKHSLRRAAATCSVRWQKNNKLALVVRIPLLILASDLPLVLMEDCSTENIRGVFYWETRGQVPSRVSRGLFYRSS